MKILYKVVEHDGGSAYKLGDVFSEASPDRTTALAAAKREAAERRCCTDPTGGARSWAGVAGRPLTCPPDAQRALQAEPEPPPPYSPVTAWIMVRNLSRVRTALWSVVETKHDPDVLIIDLDPPHQGADQVAPGRPIRLV